jgi:hypothetical protein
VTNPQFTTKPTDSPNPKPGDAGAGKAINQTWDRLQQQDQNAAIDDPTEGTGRSERDPLPHHRDLPGQETPEQDPDLEPTIGDEEGEGQDTAPTDEQQGGRSTPL